MKRAIHPPLRPPSVELDADIRWFLSAAFADEFQMSVQPASPARAARLVEEFSLTNRVVSRLSRAQLFEALTPKLAEVLSQNFRQRVMRSLAVAQVRQTVCFAAEGSGIEIALLKQAALEALGIVSPQQRYATDIDVLVRPDQLFLFCAALERQGLSRETRKHHAHGVPVLRSESGVGVELHTELFDLRLEQHTEPLTLASLHERNLLQPVDTKAPHVTTPTLAVIAAHIVAQGWYLFHFVPNAPRHKSPFRVIADITTLGLHTNETLSKATFSHIQHEGREDEFIGLVKLVQHLALGDFGKLTGLPRRLLDHAIASRLDENYRRRLVITHQMAMLRTEGIPAYFARQGRRIWQTPAESNASARQRLSVFAELARKAVLGLTARFSPNHRNRNAR
jgi:hypothetical protein